MQKFFQKNIRLNRGFTLVETLVAISIFTMSILALMAVLSQGVSSTYYAKQKIIGTYLAQEGIEFVRNLRDTYVLYDPVDAPTGWTNFNTKVGPCSGANFCGFDDSISQTNSNSIFLCSVISCTLYVSNGNYNANAIGADSGFVRTINVQVINANETKIFSTVSWTQGSGTKTITFSESVFNWIE